MKLADLLLENALNAARVTINLPVAVLKAVSGKRQSVVKYLLDLRERFKQCSELASEHAMTLQVKMKTYYDKNSRQRSLAAG